MLDDDVDDVDDDVDDDDDDVDDDDDDDADADYCCCFSACGADVTLHSWVDPPSHRIPWQAVVLLRATGQQRTQDSFSRRLRGHPLNL